MNDSLGDRMKLYEAQSQARLLRRTPTIIRIDGKAFHTFTRGMERPYDGRFHRCMWEAARALCEQVQGCRLAYVQSDEISLLLTDWDKHTTQAWFDAKVQKQASIAASICTAAFAEALTEHMADHMERWRFPAFDARCFNLPPVEVVNYFIWRQQDAERNSVSMLAQSRFSHKALHRKSCKDMMDMLMVNHGVNWNDCPTTQKRGACVVKEQYEWHTPPGQAVMRSRWVVDRDIPIFTKDREYIESRMGKPS